METKKYELPKEFASKWVEALRSGKFKQNTLGLLLFNNEYCCLGVACNIAGIDDCETRNNRLILEGGFDPKWIKMVPKELVGMKIKGSLVDEVTEMNDSKKTFNEIADWIEANVNFI